MKARKVYDAVNFKRGEDPHRALNVGDGRPEVLAAKAEAHAQTMLEYYDSDDYKGQYMDVLHDMFWDSKDYVIERIKASLEERKFEDAYDIELSWDQRNTLAPKIYTYISENFEEFVDDFRGYYVGDTSLESVSFGEEQIEIQDYEVDAFDAAGFYVDESDLIAVYQVDGGLHVDLMKGTIPEELLAPYREEDEELDESMGVGVSADGRVGSGVGNIKTPESQRKFAEEEEKLKREEALEEIDEAIDFKRGEDSYKALNIGMHLDRKGTPLNYDSKVMVYVSGDQLYDFTGRVVDLKDDMLTVRDADGEEIDLYYREVELYESVEFKRGQDAYDALDVGDNRSENWPRSYKDLPENLKPIAIDNMRTQWEKWGGLDPQWVVDDDYLLEPAHQELIDLFGKDFYEKLNQGKKYKDGPLISNNSKRVYFDIYDRTINIKDAMEVNNDYYFLKWLGIPDNLIEEVWYTIKADTIEFEENDSNYEFTDDEWDILEDAQDKFENFVYNDVLIKRIKGSYDYYDTDKAMIEEMDAHDIKFDEEGEIVEE